MSLTSEEIEKTLASTIQSMQKNMDEERKKFNDQIIELENKLNEKEGETAALREKIVLLTKNKDDKNTIESFKMEKELIEKEFQSKITEFKSALINISTLKNQLEMEKQKIMELNLEKKNLEERFNIEKQNIIEESEKKYSILQKQFFLLQKQIDRHGEEVLEYKKEINNKDIIIEKLNKTIQDLNKNIKDSQENNESLLNYIKEVNENEKRLKKFEEELKEKDKYISLKEEEINKKQKEVKKKSELEILMKKEEKEEEKVEIKNINLEGQEKLITDLLCEFLLKLNNLQFYVSLFDLLEKSLKQYDELNYIYNLNYSRHESMNDILYNFYESLKSYFYINKENSNLNDFLLQKTFRLTEIGKEEIEIIKKIKSLKINNETNILDIYRQKREIYFKSKEFTFNFLKEKILGEKSIKENQNEFFKITKAPLELEINFNEVISQNYILGKFQVHNIFSKLRELTIHISNIPIFVIYSLIINCHNLNTLKIIYIKSQSEQENKMNIEQLNIICPIMINYLKKLFSFSLINLPLSNNKLTLFVESLKMSKIKKLTLNNCFVKKEDINILIPYFSQNTMITEIDLSNHSFNIPTFLSNSLLNYNISKQLTSICFNNCKLNDDDIKYITNYIVSSSSLLVCDIGKNILSPLACSTFGYCILKTTSLETLRINECGINGESLLFIFNGKGSKPLKHVNLNGNEFGDIGLVSISAFMKNSPLLESIELEKCGGTDMGFISLANMIQSSAISKIKYVNFHKNNVTFASMGILKKFNDIFTSRKVVFALDKIEGQGDKLDIDCAIFT